MTSSLNSRESVRDAQDRLRLLGHGPLDDPPGELGPATSVAVQAFQRERGLPITGELDNETWSRLVEAGWSLGSRLLFVSRPLLRGDDVADLQEALALLGFDPGRIDGIFGSMTAGALADFQTNCALEASGVLTRESLLELSRLSSRMAGRRPVTEARDAAGLQARHARRLVILVGEGEFADDLVESLAPLATIVTTGQRTAQEAAALANDEGAGLVLAVAEIETATGIAIHYFASHRSKSLLGESLADEVARHIRAGSALPVAVSGMSIPILRETLMPALDFSLPCLDPHLRLSATRATTEAVARLFDSTR